MKEMPGLVEFHHVGYATRDVDQERGVLELLGYSAEGEPFEEPGQGVEGMFMSGSGPRIELLQQLHGATVLEPWLKAGVKIFHMAYLVDDLSRAVQWARQRRAKLVTGPKPSRTFDDSLVSFLMFPNRLMVELIEALPPGGEQ